MNLLLNPVSFDQWSYSKNVGSAYHVSKDFTLNPFGTSNLADLITADAGAYGGFNQDVVLQPNTTYYLAVWAYTPQGASCNFSLKVNAALVGNISTSLYWPGNSTPGYSSFESYVQTPVGTTLTPAPWTRYLWTFTTPSTVDNTNPSTVCIDVNGGSLVVLWGANLDTVNGNVVEPTLFVYGVDTVVSAPLLSKPSIDFKGPLGTFLTTPFLPTNRYRVTDYNLLPPPASYNLSYWSFTQSNLASGGTISGVTVSQAAHINRFGTSNLSVQAVTDPTVSEGLTIDFTLLPNTTYTLSLDAFTYGLTQAAFTMFIQNIVSGGASQLNWGGPSAPTGLSGSTQYANPPNNTSGTSWGSYFWTFTTPSNFLLDTTGSGLNARLNLFLTNNGAFSFYGINIVRGSTAIPFVEPYGYSFDANTLPTGNPILTPDPILVPHFPSIDFFNALGERTSVPFDPNRLAISAGNLGKNAIPYGNTFDKLNNLTDFAYTINQSAGAVVLGNLLLPPVDPVYNPVSQGFTADLVQFSVDPTMLAANSGGSIGWDSIPSLTTGNTYTISVWIQSKYLPVFGNMSINPGGNWSIGIQSPGSEGNLADPSWKTLNGSYTILLQNDSNNAGLWNDEGIPSNQYIPTGSLLFTKRADQIRAVPANGASPVVIESAITGLLYDISTTLESLLPADVLAAKYATLLYQEVPYVSTISTYNYDFWAKVAADYVVVSSGGVSTVDVNAQTLASIVCWGMVYTLLDGTKVVTLTQWWDILQQDSWRFQTGAGSLHYSNLQDLTKPVGFGFFFTGDLSIYGGLRIYECEPQRTSFYANNTSWTKVELSFVATQSMEYLTHFTDIPGSATGSSIEQMLNSINITVYQPSQPSPNTQFVPWAPIWSSFYIYGLWITDGASAGVYFPDPFTPVSYSTTGIPAPRLTGYPTIRYVNGPITVEANGIPAWSEVPHHPVGINVTGDSPYASSRFFLNLMKLSTAGPVKYIIDPAGVWPTSTLHGWFLYRSLEVTNVDTSFNVLDTWVNLSAPTFTAGSVTMTTPRNNGDNWSDYNPSDTIRLLTGIGVAPNTQVIGMTVDTVAAIVTFTVDTPFTGNSSGSYKIHKEAIDDVSVLGLDSDGYPTTIPAGYTPFALCYRTTPAWMWPAGEYNLPYMNSGLYTITWDGTGDISMNMDVSMSPGAFPAVEVSRTSNSITYSIDCSGNTAAGVSTSTKNFLATDVPTPNIMDSQTGFLIAITSTDPNHTGDYVRNIKLFEAQYETLITAGEVFYPEFLDRLKDFKCLRFLDWTCGNSYQPFTTIAGLTKVSEVSYSGTNMVPFEIVIELCNRMQKDCWINLFPYSSEGDAFHIYVAKLFEENLDPKLRLYIEYGNEQWNGGLGTGWWLSAAASNLGIVSPYVNPPNASWMNHLYYYAMQSQYVFDLFDSVFSSLKGKLQPVRLWDPPKTQRRRLLRCLSTMGGNSTTTSQVWEFALPFCKAASGIPYEVITPNGYIDILNDSTVVANAQSAAPNEYPWTYQDLIPCFWRQLGVQTTVETNATIDILKGQNSINYPNGSLGLDLDGEQFNPIVCLYEGGVGSAGPSPQMLRGIIDLMWEVDSPLNTVYSISQAQLLWWENTMVSMMAGAGADSDACVYNQWETANAWGSSDQWGIADKSNYTDTEYYAFPRARLYNQSAGRMGYPTLIEMTGLSYRSKPKVWVPYVGWVEMSNVMMTLPDGTWGEVSAQTLQYRGSVDWE